MVRRTWRPATDTDFLILLYAAVRLVDESRFKDRQELANRFMEIVDKYTAGTNAAVQRQWCEIWTHHGLGSRIHPSYCDDIGGFVGFP